MDDFNDSQYEDIVTRDHAKLMYFNSLSPITSTRLSYKSYMAVTLAPFVVGFGSNVWWKTFE